MKGTQQQVVLIIKKKKKAWSLVAAQQFCLFFKFPHGTEGMIYNDKVTDWDLKPLFNKFLRQVLSA